MSKIDDFIKTLPDEVQDISNRWVTLLLGKGEEYVKEWLKNVYAGDKRKAFKDLAKNLSTDLLLEEMDLLIERFKSLNNKNAEYYEMQNSLLDAIVDILIKFLIVSAVDK